MASILNSKAKTYQYDFSGNEEFKQQIQSDADIFIKELSKKQRDTEVSLEKCLRNEKEFKLAHSFNPTTEVSAGTFSYDDFKQLSATLEEEKKYLIEDNNSKETNKTISRHVKELALAVKPNSLETKLLQFAISCNAIGETRNDTRPSDHPINQLDKIENNLFSHLSYGNDPQKAAKTILRKRKQLLEAISEPIGPKKIAEPVRENSLWDVTEVASIPNQQGAKLYTCRSQPQKLYTIRDGVIVELQNEDENQSKQSKPKHISQPFICIYPKNVSDSIVSSRLSEEEIKKIPKFQNYQKGTPSNVLYLKNLSSSIKESDLVALFSKYQERDKPKIIYKLMEKGKMRGQAFITFPSVEISAKALEEANGSILYDKPIIIQYGKANVKI